MEEQQQSEPAGADVAGGVHDHDSEGLAGRGSPEQAAVYTVAVLGLLCNLLLLGVILAQRHTRRLSSAFLLHSALLNVLMSGLAIAFGRGLGFDGISSSSCQSLTTAYIIFLTVWVFNLIPSACCEIFYLDSGVGRPSGSPGCVGFGIFLVYICSAILHLGPTLIGANFERRDKNSRCLFLYGHPKNYTVHLMWTIIVSVALGVTAYYLVAFRRAIDTSMQRRLQSALGPTDVDGDLAGRLADLAGVKLSRQRVLCGLSGLFVICWYPLYLLVLADPVYRAPQAVYQLFTIVGFAKTIAEPLTLLAFDRSIGCLPMLLCPCGRRLRYVSESEIDTRLATAAAAAAVAEFPDRSPPASASLAIASASSAVGRRPPASSGDATDFFGFRRASPISFS